MFHTFCPHPALLEYVDIIIILDIDFSSASSLSPIYTFVPTHTRFLCFYLNDQVKVKKGDGNLIMRARSIIIGPQLSPVTLDLGTKHHTVIVGLKPCSLYRLLGIPMNEIVDRDFDARLVMGKEIDEVLNRLQEVKNNQLKANIIQQYLLSKLSQLKPAHPLDAAMEKLVGARGNLSIDYVASQSCISVRQFERQCNERIGLPPKLYARMIRFSHAYKLKENFPNITWIEIAHRCGYFDQMHLIRDFKFLPGLHRVCSGKKTLRLRCVYRPWRIKHPVVFNDRNIFMLIL